MNNGPEMDSAGVVVGSGRPLDGRFGAALKTQTISRDREFPHHPVQARQCWCCEACAHSVSRDDNIHQHAGSVPARSTKIHIPCSFTNMEPRIVRTAGGKNAGPRLVYSGGE